MAVQITRQIGTSVTTAGTLAAGHHTPVDAASGALTMTLPTGAPAGAHLSIEKTDTSTNTVTLTGNVRGIGSSTLTLYWTNESLELIADSSGSWWPVAGHKTKAALDGAYAAAITVLGVVTTSSTVTANTIVPVDATAGTVTITIPTAPADKTRVTVKKVDSSVNTVTIARGGTTDVFNTAAGSTSLTLTLRNQSTTVQYSTATGIWYVVAGDLPLSSLTASLSATYAKRGFSFLEPDTVFDGDSITIGSIATINGNQDRNGSWTNLLAALSMGRIRFIYNAALGGQTSAGMLSRFDTYVSPSAPKTVIATIGTNDVGQGLTMSSWLSNLAAYKAKCDGIGARLVLGEIWPTDDTTVANRGATVRTWNTALRGFCNDNGLPAPIPWTRLADPTTGGWPSGWSTDHIHPGAVAGSLASIAAFGWQHLQNLYGASVLERPSINGQDASQNGFITNITTSGLVAAPPSVTATPTTGTGTLAAGTYSYVMTSGGALGEGLPSAVVTATLTAAGEIVVAQAPGSPSGNKGFNIYRLDPTTGTYKYLAQIPSGTYSYTDDGSAVLRSITPPTVDQSAFPLGFNPGSNNVKMPGAGHVIDAAFCRGQRYRITLSNGSTSTGDYYTATGSSAAAGSVYEATALVRSDGNLAPALKIRFKDSTGADVSGAGPLIFCGDKGVLPGQTFLFWLRFTIPTTTTPVAQIRFGLECSGTLGSLGWIDVAEIGLKQVA